MSCPLCVPTELDILVAAYWRVVLNEDQGFLGRCYFALNRHETDLTSLTNAERDELWHLFSTVKAALDRLFRPDHYNYVFLMNVQPHLHGHIIPRYAEERIYGGEIFTDGGIGSHYTLENVNIPSRTNLLGLATAIRHELKQELNPT